MQEEDRRRLLIRGLVAASVYALPLLVVLGLAESPGTSVTVTGIVVALLAAGIWWWAAGMVGPRNALRLALLMWVLGLLLLASFSSLSLGGAVRYVYAAWLGVAFAGVAANDVRLLRQAGCARSAWAEAGVGAAGLVIGVSVWWLVSMFLPVGPAGGFLLFAVGTLVAWRLLRRVEDPVRGGDDPLRRFSPWSGGKGLPRREGWRRLLGAPVTTFYLIVSWALFLPLAEPRRGVLQLPSGLTERYAYAIPDLTQDPLGALTTLVTAPLVNHDIIQLVYVTLLLVVVGIPFEAREGSRRFLLVFVGIGAAGALVAGVLLHLVYPDISTHPVFETAWERTWSGGSAGAFALMGGVAARARVPWPLLGFFVFWEVNVGWWYLRSYTPAFHLSALFLGFFLVRHALGPVRSRRQDPAPATG